MFDAEQKEMLYNVIEKVKMDASDHESLEDIPIERLVGKFIVMH